MDVNFELYKVFFYVAKNLSFSEAAIQLYISQSAVSQSVKQLERQLGVQLFLRNTKQVKLTQAGHMLFKHVEQAFNILKTGERQVYELHSLEQGTIKLGASDTICKYFLLPYLKRFNQLHPQIKLNITNRPSPVCVELLKKGLIDCAVINIPQAASYTNLAATPLKMLQDVFIAGPAHAYLKDSVNTLTDLVKQPLLLLEDNTTTRAYFDSLVSRYGISVVPEIELGSLDLLLELTKMGLGISFASQNYIEKELARGELFILSVDMDIPPRYLGIITHNHLPVPIAAQKLIDLLQNG